eukprot:TRINITY_DN443_c6_g2_i1.p1 TRINITY_DN443_c6_g2~~TRINITY_DN443_c6_g2_i1.p1  ORF type:complete len:1051 (+),score=330.10 TRINITY_DN443_c6_g2_i1:166-3318(+)
MAAGAGGCPWTPAPGKKDLSKEMAAAYDPKEVEKEWYDWWEKSGFFRPRSDFEGGWDCPETREGKQFTICLPPPNVTGYLHLGHALTSAIQDTVIRWRRMLGQNVLWIPGTDHAGIATQVVTEKKLKKQTGQSRHDIGREAFLEKVWEVKAAHHAHITKQLRLTGASLDWSREFFTMDDARATAVTEAFVRMYDSKVIYRATRLIHWSCALQSAISDLEVEYVEATGSGVDAKANGTLLAVPGYEKKVMVGLMYHFYYVIEGTGEKLEVATTRPETILGDTAVAVHPDDDRYKHLHGKRAVCPFRDESIPIVTDGKLVDKDFGTGVVKVTPAHDPNDFECGQRNKLPQLTMLDKDGNICLPGEFKGMKRFDARKAVVEALKAKGLLVKTKGHNMKIGICSRSKDIIEPLLMPQWFCDCTDMARRSLEAEQTKALKLVPERPNAKIWSNWLENIRPWCISRQLWWGHRIPAYFATRDGSPISADAAQSWFVGRTEEEARKRMADAHGMSADEAAKVQLERDPDVLDTWFSSGLLPHSCLGWPNEDAADFKQFFPTQLLETGHDILFFWVARMTMTSFQFCDKLPFDTCFLHSMVRDREGRKMSKSTGNVVDPLDMVNGITLAAMQEKLRHGNLDEKEVERARKNQEKMFPKIPKRREDGGLPECGSDALRFGLLTYTSNNSRDANLDTERIVNIRYFCNKLWNSIRFGMTKLGLDYQPPAKPIDTPVLLPDGQLFKPWAENPLVDATTRTLRSRCTGTRVYAEGEEVERVPFVCAWILSRLDTAVAAANRELEQYRFDEAVQSIYSFWYDDFCDWMIEMSKAIFTGDAPHPDAEAFKHVMWTCLETGLRLLHPMMPFVTEELWNRLPGEKTVSSIMIARYPEKCGWRNPQVEERFKVIQGCTKAIRSVRGQYNIPDKVRINCTFTSRSEDDLLLLRNEGMFVAQCAKANITDIRGHTDERMKGCIVSVVDANTQCHIEVAGHIDVEKEKAKQAKELGILTKSMQGLEKKMATPGYADRVPQNVQEENATKMASLTQQIADINQAIESLASM